MIQKNAFKRNHLLKPLVLICCLILGSAVYAASSEGGADLLPGGTASNQTCLPCAGGRTAAGGLLGSNTQWSKTVDPVTGNPGSPSEETGAQAQ